MPVLPSTSAEPIPTIILFAPRLAQFYLFTRAEEEVHAADQVPKFCTALSLEVSAISQWRVKSATDQPEKMLTFFF